LFEKIAVEIGRYWIVQTSAAGRAMVPPHAPFRRIVIALVFKFLNQISSQTQRKLQFFNVYSGYNVSLTNIF